MKGCIAIMQKVCHMVSTFIILRQSAYELQEYFVQFYFSGTQIHCNCLGSTTLPA